MVPYLSVLWDELTPSTAVGEAGVMLGDEDSAYIYAVLTCVQVMKDV
jgi:hypothetical protein